jgi:predicted ATPase
MAAARPLVGRAQHLASLAAAFRRSREGHAVIAYVHGASGMGKTVLIRRFLHELQREEKDVVVLAGRCYETESVPYKALDSLVDGLSQHLRRLPRAQAEAPPHATCTRWPACSRCWDWWRP